jgi:hypothetical protein
MIEDLSTHHQLVGDLFAGPKDEREWNRYQLTAAQIEFYEANGTAGALARNERCQARTKANALVHEKASSLLLCSVSFARRCGRGRPRSR